MYAADYHVHSTCSPDGKMTMSQAAEAALRAGLDEICITDHVDTIYWGSNEPRDSFDWDASMTQYLEAVDKFGDKLSIKLGAELGEANLSFDRAEILLNSAKKLDFSIGSVHTCSEKFHCLDLYFLEAGKSPDYYAAVIEDYLDSVLAIARWGRFSVLGHLTLPLRYLKEHLNMDLTFDPWRDRIREIFSTVIPKGVGIECNTNRGNRPLPDADLLRVPGDGGRNYHPGLRRPRDQGCGLRYKGAPAAPPGLRVPVFHHLYRWKARIQKTIRTQETSP